jgi:hypothetical protein
VFPIAELVALNNANRERCALGKRESAIRPRRTRHCRSRFAATLLAALLSLAGARWVPAQSNVSSEYQVKAAFLFHFAQFVEWPPETFKDANTPFTYCTIGEDPFHGVLDAGLSGKTIGGRPLRVQHLKAPRETESCQVLFIGDREQRHMEAAMANANGNSVLTVGESIHFANEGGIIGFCLEQNKIRFEINLDAAKNAKLKISAKLLALAKTVIGNPRGN